MPGFSSRTWLALGALAALALALALWSNRCAVPPRIAEVEAKPGVGLIEVSFVIESGCSAEVTVTAEPLKDGGPAASARVAGVGRRVVELKVAGGVGYKVTVTCEAGGHSHSVKLFVPYVWALEDVASTLAGGIVISAVYVPWNMADVLGRGWSGDAPLLGFYDAIDDEVQWKHVDWARGYGIGVFWVDWTNYAYGPARERVLAVTRGLLEKGMKVGVMLGPQVEMRAGEGYPSIDLSDPLNKRILLELAEMAAHFMNHPNYYRLEGRPVLLIWNEAAFYNRAEAYRGLRELVKRVCGVEPYVVADALPRVMRGMAVVPGTPEGEWYLSNILLRRGDGGDAYIDAYTSWIGFLSVQGELALTGEELARFPQLYEAHLAAWSAYALSRGKCVVPTVSPGFDRTHDPSFNQLQAVKRDVDRFSRLLKAALASATASGCREVRIDTWNDFYEATFVEPSARERFAYLEAIRSAVAELRG